jgi:hypothetical protein
MTLLILAVALVATTAWIVLWFGRGAWLKISSALFLLQPSVGPPLHALWQLGTSPYMLWRSGGFLRSPLTGLLVVFAGVNAASAAWSPEPRTAIFYSITTILAVALMLHGTLATARDTPQAIGATLRLLSPVVVIQALSTIVFRFDTGTELQYYGSAPARLLLGEGGRGLVTGELTNNVLDPGKAGGVLFLNGNRASMVMGVAALVYLMFALTSRSRAAAAVALLSAIGCAFSGSKTGITLVLVTPALAVFWAAMVRSAYRTKLVSVLVMSAAVVATVIAVPRYASDYVDRSDAALVPRRILWDTAWQAWAEHPWRGLGFGGWENFANQRLPSVVFRDVSPVVFEPNYPPHNMLLFSMTRVGIIGPVLILLITLVAIRMCVRGMRRRDDVSTRLVMSLGAVAWVWVFVHAMGDNTDVWGTLNTVPFLGFALAICAGLHAGSGDAEPPEVQDHRPVAATSSRTDATSEG